MAKFNQAMTDLFRYNTALAPSERSGFDKSHSHTTTFDSARLVPIMWDRVIPGDEKKIRVSALARMATPYHPVMDQANLDIWAFYIPDRLWWEHARQFYGENLDAEFNEDGEYEMPSLTPAYYGVNTRNSYLDTGIGSLADYFGFPIIEGGYISNWDESHMNSMRQSAGLFRCYQLIWNEWFRNSSVQNALRLSKGDTVTNEEWDVIKRIRNVCKYPDYFTMLLKSPQAGDDVMMPLGEWAPVVARDELVTEYGELGDLNGNNTEGMKIQPFNTERFLDANAGTLFTTPGTGIVINSTGGFGDGSPLAPSNLWANLTYSSAATINNIRAAVTVQHLLETDALAGKRYQNLLQAHFGVFTPDATLQRPELLGQSRTTVGMRQVLQTSATEDGSTPLGNTAAFSLTNVANEWICNKAFTEPGFIMVLCAVRPVHSYSQGISPLLSKLHRYDHYYPVFDHLGNQPVYKKYLFGCWTDSGAHAPGNTLDKVLGYSEAWAEYRFMNNRVSGLMRPDNARGNLATWNYADYYDTAPTLNDAFVEENEQLIDRTIVEQNQPQFILDCYFDYKDYKPMAVHSTPGLLYL